MANFIDGLKVHYVPGMSYSNFKKALNPGIGLPAIKPEGEILLQQAHNYLALNTSENNMDGKSVYLAIHAIVKNNSNISYTTDSNLELGSQWLFGLNNSSPALSTQSTNGCRWFQLGCWWNQLWHWLSTSASGGGRTNGETLAAVVTVVAAIFGIIIAL